MNKIKKYIEKINNPVYKKLIENFLSLSLLQVINRALPLLTYPYRINILGIENHGVLVMAFALNFYFILITDFGFNLSAVKKIAVAKNDINKISEIFSAVMSIKFILMIISFILLTVIVMSVPKYRINYQAYFLYFGMVVGTFFFPVFFFQGIQKMIYITLFHTLARVLFTISIFIFIKKSDDYLYVAILNSAGALIAGLVSLYVIFFHYKIKFRLQPWSRIKEYFVESWHPFLSIISVNIYSTGNLFILGTVTNNAIAGAYDIAVRLVKIILDFISVIFQTIYPHICALARDSFSKVLNFFKKTTFVLFAAVLTIVILAFYIFPDYLLLLFKNLGQNDRKIILTSLKILAFSPILLSLNIPAYQTLLAYNFGRYHSRTYTIGMIFSISTGIILMYFFKHIGAALTTVATEALILIGLYYFLHKADKNLSYIRIILKKIMRKN